MEFRILHVEDDENYSALIKTYLTKISKDVIVLSTDSPPQALSYLEEGVDAVVCDGEIPDWRGHINEIRNLSKNKPFMILSGATEDVLAQFTKQGIRVFQKGPVGQAGMLEYMSGLVKEKCGQ